MSKPSYTKLKDLEEHAEQLLRDHHEALLDLRDQIKEIGPEWVVLNADYFMRVQERCREYVFLEGGVIARVTKHWYHIPIAYEVRGYIQNSNAATWAAIQAGDNPAWD